MKRLAVPSLLLLLAAARPLSAEVAVEVVGNGGYRTLRIAERVADGRTYYWDRNGGSTADHYLNLDGDARGDRGPLVEVIPRHVLQADPSPVVVWSRNGGTDFEIYYSRWQTSNGWSAPQRIGGIAAVDDLGLDLFLDPRDDVHAVWWSNGAVPSVWYSKFDNGVWSNPERISNPLVDSRHPTLVLDGNSLYIQFENWALRPVGTETRLKEHFDP